MEPNPYVIALIPARGGSKRLPRKNVLPLRGTPLIEWSIHFALNSRSIDRVFVSTDDPEIKQVSLRAGAEVFERSKETGSDTATTLSVVREFLSQLDRLPDYLVLLQPTTPFRKQENLEFALKSMVETGADMAIGVSKAKMPPAWLLTQKGGFLEPPNAASLARSRSQEQPPFFQINGALYVYSMAAIEHAKDYVFGEKTIPILLDSPWDLDIDTLDDFRIAQGIAHEYDFIG